MIARMIFNMSALEKVSMSNVASKNFLRSTPLPAGFLWNGSLGLYLNEITLGSMDF